MAQAAPNLMRPGGGNTESIVENASSKTAMGTMRSAEQRHPNRLAWVFRISRGNRPNRVHLGLPHVGHLQANQANGDPIAAPVYQNGAHMRRLIRQMKATPRSIEDSR